MLRRVAAGALPGLPGVRPAVNVFITLAETNGAGELKIPGGAVAYRGYSVLRLGSPEKAQRAASGNARAMTLLLRFGEFIFGFLQLLLESRIGMQGRHYR